MYYACVDDCVHSPNFSPLSWNHYYQCVPACVLSSISREKISKKTYPCSLLLFAVICFRSLYTLNNQSGFKFSSSYFASVALTWPQNSISIWLLTFFVDRIVSMNHFHFHRYKRTFHKEHYRSSAWSAANERPIPSMNHGCKAPALLHCDC